MAVRPTWPQFLHVINGQEGNLNTLLLHNYDDHVSEGTIFHVNVTAKENLARSVLPLHDFIYLTLYFHEHFITA